MNTPIDRRPLSHGKAPLTRAEWQAIPRINKEGRASKDARTSKARAFVFSYTEGTYIAVPVYITKGES